MRRVLLVLVALLLVPALGEARHCRRACAPAVARCRALDPRPRHCQRTLLRACRHHGTVMCALPFPTTTSTTTSTSTTSTTIAGGGICGVTNTLTVSVDGTPFVPTFAHFFVASQGHDVAAVFVVGSADAPAHSEVSIVSATGEPGTFPASATWVDNGDPTFEPPSAYTVTGTLTVTKLVLGTPTCIAGSFDVTFTNGSLTRHLTGTYFLSQTP